MRLYPLTRTQVASLEKPPGYSEMDTVASVHTLDRAPDLDLLGKAAKQVFAQFGVLRRSLVRSEGAWFYAEPAAENLEVPYTVVDLRGQGGGARFSIIERTVRRSYSVDDAVLAHLSLVIGDHTTTLVFTAAPFLIDPFSLRPIWEALSRAYQGHDLPADAEISQEFLLEAEQKSEAWYERVRFWTTLLRDKSFEWQPPANLLPDSRNLVTLQPKLPTSELDALASELGFPVEMLLTTLFHLWLYRLTGSVHILTALELRTSLLETTKRVGQALLEGVIVSQIEAQMELRSWLAGVSRLYHSGLMHTQIAARDVLTEMLHGGAVSGRLTNVLFAPDLELDDCVQFSGVQSEWLPELTPRLGSCDLAVWFRWGVSPRFTLISRDPRQLPSLALSFERYLDLLRGVSQALELPLDRVPLFTPQARAETLLRSQGPRANRTASHVLHLLAHTVRTHAGQPALRFGQETWNYGEIWERVERLARAIVALVEGQQEALVGILTGRSADMVVAALAVLRAGAAYVPLDPANPPERLALILEDARIGCLLCDATTRETATQTGVSRVVDLTDAEMIRTLGTASSLPDLASLALNQLAYVIYTSGTTGRPKGVAVEHGNLACLLAACATVAPTGVGHRWLQFASLGFDVSVYEIFCALTSGALLVVCDSERRTRPEAIHAMLETEAITHAYLPPAVARLLPQRPLPALSDLLLAGEATDPVTARFWSKSTRLWNGYGPTEITVLCSMHPLDARGSANTLGHPLPGYSMYLLDSHFEPVPDGGVGELWIGGEGVTRGYLGRDELTAERFVPNPFGAGRLYRSGDLARRFPDGSLEYLGRNDFQVKVRGFRIELGDIETAIRRVVGVTGVLVATVEQATGKALAAWYTSPTTQAETVRSALIGQLPHYMVPTWLVRLDAFPLNMSGKIDRSRLSLPLEEASSGSTMSPFERQIADVWAEVLHCPPGDVCGGSNFFHLGGHSLLASLVCARLSKALGQEVRPSLLMRQPVLSAFVEHLQLQAHQEPLPTLEPGAVQATPVTSSILTLIWSRAEQRGADNTYTIPTVFRLSARHNPVLVRQALVDVLASHDLFSYRFEEREGRLWLVQGPKREPQVRLVACRDEELDAYCSKVGEEVFELSSSPLVRATLVLSETGGAVLLLAVHHAIFDGWSLNLLCTELGQRYDALLAGQSFVASSEPSMIVHQAWLLHPSVQAARNLALGYWEQKLQGVQARLELPVQRSTSRPDANRWLPLRFEAAVTEQLRACADRLGCTLPPVLFSAYLVWLWRLSGSNRLTVTYPQAGRDVPGTQQVWGMLVTMAYLHLDLDTTQGFEDLVTQVAAQMVRDSDHTLASPLDLDLSNVGASSVMFSLQSGISLEGTMGGVPFTVEELPSLTSKADLAGIFYLTPQGRLEGRLEYDGSRFGEAQAASFADALACLVRSCALDPKRRICDQTYLSESARSLLARYSQGPVLTQAAPTLVHALREAEVRYATLPALRTPTVHLDYAQLGDWSERMARALRASHALKRGECVGVCVRKSAELVVSMIAVLKAGCAYVPLDPEYPADRLRYMIENSGLQVLVADATGQAIAAELELPGLTCFDPSTVAQTGNALAGEPHQVELPEIRPHDLAYVIYTSGSTGRPKGVMIEHRSVPRQLAAVNCTFGLAPRARLLWLGTPSFDASVVQVFTPLVAGAELLLAEPEVEKQPQRIAEAMRELEVTHQILVPSLLRSLPQEPLPALRKLGFGGEALDATTAAYWSRATELLSLYGPTEITVTSSMGPVHPEGPVATLGKPLPGYSMQILDGRREPVIPGAVGEIYIGGGNHARGYLGRPDLTAERFVLDPYGVSPYVPLYRSGDLGRFLADGSIEYLGRNDNQVKLRGYRIEIGEIEVALAQLSGVSHAAAAVVGEGDLRALAAYLVGEQRPDDEVRAELEPLLPAYMMPSYFVWLPSLPLTANGKLDRKALPEVRRGGSGGEPPQTPLEQRVAAVFEQVLRLQGIGRHDSFFDLGGNSLLVARLQTGLQEEAGLKVAARTIYSHPTVAGIASVQVDSSIEEAVALALAGLGEIEGAGEATPQGPVRHVLLTGASGFLGSYLLVALLARVERVTCLVRARDLESALDAVVRAVRETGAPFDLARVDIVLGSLDAPRLGLDDATWTVLEESVDAIVHCGAWVHHLYSYATLRAANVDSTRELLRMALRRRRKRFCFVSTESVGEALRGLDEVPETLADPVQHPPLYDMGYLLSKWAAEQLVGDARRRYGLEATVVRPGNITGDTLRGYSNYRINHAWLLTKGCIQFEAFPDLPTRMEMLPVDCLAARITALLLAPTLHLEVANLGNPNDLSWSEYMRALARLGGFALQQIEISAWQGRLAGIDESHALWTLRELYTGDLTQAPPRVQRAETTAFLEGLGLAPVPPPDVLLPLYVNYLRGEGFLPATVSS